MKRFLTGCLMAVMVAGLVACGSEGKNSHSSDDTSLEAGSTEGATSEKKDSGKKKDAHFDPDASGNNHEDNVHEYSEIPESVIGDMKKYADKLLKEFLEEHSDEYENVGKLKYEGNVFRLEVRPDLHEVDSNDLYFIYSTRGTKVEDISGEKKELDLCFNVGISNVYAADDKTYTYGDKHVNEVYNMRAEFEYDYSQLMTLVYQYEAEYKKAGVTYTVHDGFEKFGEYKRVTKVEDMEKAPFFDFMKTKGVSNINQYMEDDFGENIHFTEPEYYGCYLLNDGAACLVYKSVISDSDGLCEDTEVFFSVKFNDACFTNDDKLMYSSSSSPFGYMFLGDSAYELRAYENIKDMIGIYDDGKIKDDVVDMTDSLKIE